MIMIELILKNLSLLTKGKSLFTSTIFILIIFHSFIGLFSPIVVMASEISIEDDNKSSKVEKIIESERSQAIILSNNDNTKNTPIIGVLTQVFRDYKRYLSNRTLHLPSSYIKWLESSGAQAIPILLNQDDSYYQRIFSITNGLLFPGGDNLLDPKKETPMMIAAKKLYKLAVDANNRGDHYPIWGTCLGMELLTVLSSGKNTLTSCDANDIVLPLEFVERGRLFSPSNYMDLANETNYSDQIIAALRDKNLTYNFHHKCITLDSLKRANLTNFYKPLALSDDINGNSFVSIFEARHYPFYGVQFHPEKAPYEFQIINHQHNIPHSRLSIALSRYFADYFVSSARLNKHQAKSKISNFDMFIYDHCPMYTGKFGDMYEQRYLFPYKEVVSVDSSEFVENSQDYDQIDEHVDPSARSNSNLARTKIVREL